MIEIVFTVQPDFANIVAPVTIHIETEEWDTPTETDFFEGEYPDIQNLKLFLRTAYCMYGHSFDLEFHTARQLWEVFKENRANFTVDPPCPPDDFVLPDGACY